MPAFSFAQDSSKQFIVSGNIAGLTDGEVKITTSQNDHAVVASAMSTNGMFTVKGSVPEPALYLLVLGAEQPLYLYLENAPITVSGNKTDLKSIQIEGSKSHKDFIEFNTVFNPIMGNLNAAAAQIQQETNAKKRETLIARYDSLVNVLSIEVGNFVSSNRSSYVSPFLLWVTSQVTPNIALMEQHFNLIDPAIRNNSQIGKSLGEYIAYTKVGAIGTDAVDFTQNDTSGKAISLSSFKGKYVLVDFWASWCKPCRMENPNVVKNYNKYKDKNFTVIGVSLDQQKDSWVQAIKKDGLGWNHVSDLQYWNNAVAQLYRIQSIPGNFLVDPNGKIIAKDLHGEDLGMTLQKFIGASSEPVKTQEKQKTKTKKQNVKTKTKSA